MHSSCLMCFSCVGSYWFLHISSFINEAGFMRFFTEDYCSFCTYAKRLIKARRRRRKIFSFPIFAKSSNPKQKHSNIWKSNIPENPKSPTSENPKIPKSQNPKLRNSENPNPHRHPERETRNAKIWKSETPRIPKCENPKLRKFQNAKIRKSQSPNAHRSKTKGKCFHPPPPSRCPNPRGVGGGCLECAKRLTPDPRFAFQNKFRFPVWVTPPNSNFGASQEPVDRRR